MALKVDIRVLEEARLTALRKTGLLDSPPEHLFDLITALAAKTLNVPVVLMSLVDADRQFFKSQCGLPSPLAEERQTPLSHSFCQYVAAVGEPFVVEDARVHPLVRENGAVAEIGVVAYAGVPLMTEEGHTLGSLCAIDFKPRRWSPRELEILRDFARQTMAEITSRMRLKSLDENLGMLRASVEESQTRTRHLVHDLRTPLNAVYLGIEGLPMMGELNADQLLCVELVRKNANALRDLMHQLIDVGTRQGPPPERPVLCLPHELVDRALDQVATLAEKAGVRLESSDVVPVPGVMGHADDLVRVLVNLLANGLKFTPRGGEVSIALQREQQNGTGAIRFLVRDTGIGIAPNDQTRIFREGVRLDEGADPHQSSGIGLAFCQRVVEEHGGQLRVESTPGVGSTFSFALAIGR